MRSELGETWDTADCVLVGHIYVSSTSMKVGKEIGELYGFPVVVIKNPNAEKAVWVV